jgi:hypothetical protein
MKQVSLYNQILITCTWVYFFNKNWRNSALKTREKPYYGKNSRKALVSSIPLNIMEHVIADLLFIFRLQNLTQEVEIYYIGSVLVVPSLFEIE